VSLSAKLLRDHLNIFVSLEEAADQAEDGSLLASARRGERAPRQERRGAGVVGPVVQLPQERQHPDDSGAGAEDEAEMLKTKNFGRKS